MYRIKLSFSIYFEKTPSFTDKGLLEEVRKSLKQEHYEPLSTIDDLEEEDAIEVKPEIMQRIESNPHRSLRNSTVDDDTNGKKQGNLYIAEQNSERNCIR